MLLWWLEKPGLETSPLLKWVGSAGPLVQQPADTAAVAGARWYGSHLAVGGI